MATTPALLTRCALLASRTPQSTSRCLRCASSSGLARRRTQPNHTRRFQTTSVPAQAEAAAAAADAPTNPKIASIVEDISKLTLLETTDLIATLKIRLNIPDMPMGGFAMGMGGGAGGGAAPAAAVEEDEPAPAAAEKTLFNMKLQSFETTSKPKVIKEIKSLLGLSLVDSKKFVESAPKMMKEGVPKEEAEKMVETMKGLGAVVVME